MSGCDFGFRSNEMPQLNNTSQSKLALNAATTRVNATNIDQSDLGVSAYDDSIFTLTNGWVSIADGQLDLKKIKRVSDGTVLGNWSGDSSDNDIDEIFDAISSFFRFNLLILLHDKIEFTNDQQLRSKKKSITT